MSEYESDDEADNSLSPSVIGGARPTDAADATAATLADYMQQMDVELAATTIGQSFEKRSHDTEQVGTGGDARLAAVCFLLCVLRSDLPLSAAHVC